jgi:hypothetical protein
MEGDCILFVPSLAGFCQNEFCQNAIRVLALVNGASGLRALEQTVPIKTAAVNNDGKQWFHLLAAFCFERLLIWRQKGHRQSFYTQRGPGCGMLAVSAKAGSAQVESRRPPATPVRSKDGQQYQLPSQASRAGVRLLPPLRLSVTAVGFFRFAIANMLTSTPMHSGATQVIDNTHCASARRSVSLANE